MIGEIKEKKKQNIIQATCRDIKSSLINDIKNIHTTLNIQFGEAKCGIIFNIYRRIENFKPIFESCEDVELKAWFNKLFDFVPHPYTPQGNFRDGNNRYHAVDFKEHFETIFIPKSEYNKSPMIAEVEAT